MTDQPMLRAHGFLRADAGTKTPPFDRITLDHAARRLRRKLLTLDGGGEVLVDLPATVSFETGDLLVLDDQRTLEIVAALEPLFEIRGRDTGHLIELAWHLGNRHLSAELIWTEQSGGRILIARDHVIRQMLVGLGAELNEINAPFSPVRGAYHEAHGHALLNR